jgi:TPP-dependent 2-oxoacid decarboxylase
MGKGSVDETLPWFGGVYGGAGSYPDVKKVVESSDAILWVGRYGVSGPFQLFSTQKVPNIFTRAILIRTLAFRNIRCISYLHVGSGEFTVRVDESKVIDFQRFHFTVCQSNKP